MEDDVFPEGLAKVLQMPDQAFIEMDPPIPYERAPLEFGVRFRKFEYDTAAARDEFTVEWDFGDKLRDKGWVVSHYFQLRKKPEPFTVLARVFDADGHAITDGAGNPLELAKEVTVNRTTVGHGLGERTRAEGLKLLAALLIAVFGLVSGAQDQLLKLDILPALVAVFLIGFSADSIRRLLTTEATK
jgi:hypothetical protein